MTSSAPRALRWITAATLLSACGGSSLPGRPLRLVSGSTALDQGIAAAQQLALGDGRYDQAAQLLEGLRARHRGDLLAHVASLRLARVELARAVGPEGDPAGVTRAAQLAVSVPAGVDPALDMQRALVLGLLAARQGAVSTGVSLLRPLDGRMIDPGENASVACGLLALETDEGGDPARALRSLARVEAAVEAAVRWLPTGLTCEDARARRAALDAVLARVQSPQVLADALDLLPAGYAGRVVIARRLRELARARREVSQWLRWLADLGDEEATLSTEERGDRPEPFTVGLLVPIVGERSVLGVGVVRAVQIALAGHEEVRVLVEDEGRNEEDLHRAFDTLRARGARWIIGPTREELGRPIAQWAQHADVALYLLAPWEDALPFGAVQLAAPGLRDRLAAVREVVARRGRRVAVLSPEDAPAQGFAQRLRVDLGAHDVPVAPEAASDVRVLAASFPSAERERIARRAATAPTRWVLDARLGWNGVAGVWVGVARGPAFESVHDRFCQLTGRPPGELALLAHDAARAILQAARGEEVMRATTWSLRATALHADGSSVDEDRVAAAVPCRETVLPRPTPSPEED